MFKTEKAKNDYETVIYALRDWINEEENMPFVGASKVEEIQEILREAENWLEEDGYNCITQFDYFSIQIKLISLNANYEDYQSRYIEINGKFSSLKMRKEEYGLRDQAVDNAKSKLQKLMDKVDDWTTKKAWITADQKKDVIDKIKEVLAWLEDVVEKQKGIALDEDPAFKVSEIDNKLKRANQLFDRVNSTPKPKEKDTDSDGKKKKKKTPKNIKIDNMNFDGNSDINWDDFISMNNGDEDVEEDTNTQQDETTNQQQQQEDQQQSSQDHSQQEDTKKPYDASEEDL